MLNSIEKKWNNKNGKFFKGKCNKCGKYGHRASDCWGNRNKNDNRNVNKIASYPRFKRELNNFGKRDQKSVICWAKKGK